MFGKGKNILKGGPRPDYTEGMGMQKPTAMGMFGHKMSGFFTSPGFKKVGKFGLLALLAGAIHKNKV